MEISVDTFLCYPLSNNQHKQTNKHKANTITVTYTIPQGILPFTHSGEASGEDFAILQVFDLNRLGPFMGKGFLEERQATLDHVPHE